MKNKEIEDIVKDAETIICITNKGIYINGDSPEILTLYTRLTKEMLNVKGTNKDILKNAFDMAFMNKNELIDLLKSQVSTFIDDILKDNENNEDTTE